MWSIEHERAYQEHVAFKELEAWEVQMRIQAIQGRSHLMRQYGGKPCVCSECLTGQIFRQAQCAGCHSEFGDTCWPYTKGEELREDSMNRVDHLSQDLLDRLDAAERSLTHLSVQVFLATQAQ